VRELKNVIERAVILSSGDRLRLDLAMPEIPTGRERTANVVEPDRDFQTETERREHERENLLSVLEASGWKISGPGGAAERLGVKPSTLAYRIKVFAIEKSREKM
jgi:transcriptional regulator with GAF, ATPase, and Fis domain